MVQALCSLSKRVGPRCLWLFAVAGVSVQIALGQNNGPFQSTNANDILQQFRDQRILWTTNIWVYANTLFGILAVIEFAWSAAVMLLEKTDLQSWTSALIRKLMWIGAFYALLINGRIWIPAIIDSFSQIGANAAAMAGPLSPGDVFVQGLNISGALMDAGSTSAFFTNPGTSLALILCAVLIMISYIIITLNFIVTMVESYLVVSVGFIFLGFGGSRWTVPYTERYIGLAISIGIKIVLLYCLISAGMNLGVGWINEADTVATAAHPNMVAFDVMGAALIFMMCCWHIPKLFAAVLGGAPALTGGDLWGTGMAVVGTGVAAASLGVGAVAGLAGGSAALAGTGSAAGAGPSGSGVTTAVASVGSAGSGTGAAGGSVPPPSNPPRGPSTNGGGPRRQPDPPASDSRGTGAGLESTVGSRARDEIPELARRNGLPSSHAGTPEPSALVLAGVGGEPLTGSGFEAEDPAKGFSPSFVNTNAGNPGNRASSSSSFSVADQSKDGDTRSGGIPPDVLGSNSNSTGAEIASEISSVGSAGFSDSQPPRRSREGNATAAGKKPSNSLRGVSRRIDDIRYRFAKLRLPSDAAPHQSPPRMPVEHEE